MCVPFRMSSAGSNLEIARARDRADWRLPMWATRKAQGVELPLALGHRIGHESHGQRMALGGGQ